MEVFDGDSAMELKEREKVSDDAGVGEEIVDSKPGVEGSKGEGSRVGKWLSKLKGLKGGKMFKALKGSKDLRSASCSWRPKVSPESSKDMAEDGVIARENLQNVKKLGEGASAVVDLCVYSSPTGLLYPVAVKKLKPEVFRNETDRKCFLNESKLLRKMRHPSIVSYLGVGNPDMSNPDIEKKCDAWERVYLVQEFMNKGTLKSMVQQQMCTTGRRVYSNTQALKWALQIAKGLRYLHKSKPKVIHRDLKMENVLLKQNDDGEIVAKLADFGLCAMLDSGDTHVNFVEDCTHNRSSFESTFTQSSIEDNDFETRYNLTGKTGSLMYMAPEVLRLEKYNEKCDIFSFGIILYELLIRATLLTFVSLNGDPSEVENHANLVASGQRPRIPKAVPKPLRQLIERCWGGDINDRPSASHIVRELDMMLQDEDILMDLDTSQSCTCCAIQ